MDIGYCRPPPHRIALNPPLTQSKQSQPLLGDPFSLMSQELYKLHIMVDAMRWNDSNNSLAAVADGLLLVWYYPEVIYMDRDLLPQTVTKQTVILRHCACLLHACYTRTLVACCCKKSDAFCLTWARLASFGLI